MEMVTQLISARPYRQTTAEASQDADTWWSNLRARRKTLGPAEKLLKMPLPSDPPEAIQ